MYNKKEPYFLVHAYLGCQSNLRKWITRAMHVQSQGDKVLISRGMSACGDRKITSRPSLRDGVCSTRQTQGLWRLLHFLNGTRRSRRQELMGKADHPPMSAVRKQSL